jgi:hypothetical protein
MTTSQAIQQNIDYIKVNLNRLVKSTPCNDIEALNKRNGIKLLTREYINLKKLLKK